MRTSAKTPVKTAPLFREVQRFRQGWVWGILTGTVALVVFLWYMLYQQLARGIPQGDNPAPDALLVALAVGMTLLALGLVTLFWRARLVVEVHPGSLHVRFWPLGNRRFPLADIEHAEAVTYRPLRDYGGWGLRYGPKSRAYNVSGDRGVQLSLAGDEKLLIGSQRSEALAAAVAQARRSRP